MPRGYVDSGLPSATQLDYDGSSNLIYVGRALAGTPTSEASWQISKFTYSGSNVTKVEWANGARNFNNVWDDRVSLPYS